MVTSTGEVAADGLADRVRRAKMLAWIVDGGKVVGTSALKRPVARYRQRLFESAGLTEAPGDYRYELGWVVVAETHRGRGLSRELVKPLIAQVHGEYLLATSVASREHMHRTLTHFGFVASGRPFESRRRETQLVLFLRPPDLLSEETSDRQCGSR